MRYRIADDARPRVKGLAGAMAVSLFLWLVSLFVPAAGYLVYPLQIFATFVHEAGHALAALFTGNSVSSLTVSPDASGMVWSTGSGLAGLLIASAGYVGTTAFGAALIVWLRYARSAKAALIACAVLITAITLGFGLVLPFLNILEGVTLLSVAFTVVSGMLLAAALAAVAIFAPPKWANFALAFLAVQCLLNSFFSLRDLLGISAFSQGEHTDAVVMASATGIPALIWVGIWIVISVAMMGVAFRVYASRRVKPGEDTVFLDG